MELLEYVATALQDQTPVRALELEGIMSHLFQQNQGRPLQQPDGTHHPLQKQRNATRHLPQKQCDATHNPLQKQRDATHHSLQKQRDATRNLPQKQHDATRRHVSRAALLARVPTDPRANKGVCAEVLSRLTRAQRC